MSSGILPGGAAAELGGGPLGGFVPVVLRHDRLAQGFLGVPRVDPRGQQAVDLGQRQLGEQREILPHRLVGDAHDLAELVLGRLGDPDVIPQALAHPPVPSVPTRIGMVMATCGSCPCDC